MLQTIREHTQGWIAGTIISLIILSFALWGIHSYIGASNANTTVAVVNGTDITKEQLTLAYERLRRQAQAQQGAPVTGSEDVSLKDKALKGLIDIQVLRQAAVAQGFQVSNQQIDNYLQSMPEFQVDGQFSIERFQEILASTMMSTADFLELIRTSLLIEQPKLGILMTAFSLPDEVAYTIALVNQERDVSYINIPLSHFLARPISISPEKIKAYYDAHQEEFKTPEQVNVEYIQLSPSDLAGTFNPSEAELKAFYNENVNTYTQSTSWKLADVIIPVAANATHEQTLDAHEKANAVMRQLRSGEDVKKVGMSYPTKNLMSKGVLTLNQVPAELQKAVAEMTTQNQVSEPIKTSDGLVVVKVVEYHEPKIQSFDVVKDKVRETYIRQHAEEKFSEVRDRLADMTYEHPESLQPAAKALNMQIKTSELFARDKAGKDISQYKKVRDVAFSNDVMNLQNNSDVIQLNPETVIVIRVKSHIASTLLPLNDISAQIEEKLKTKEAEVQADQFADDIVAKLNAGADPASLAASQQLTWHHAGFMGRYSTKVDTSILDTAFRLPNPDNMNHKAMYGKSRIPTGYAVVSLLAVKGGVSTDAKQDLVFDEQVQNSIGLLEYELYKQSQTNKSDIEITAK